MKSDATTAARSRPIVELSGGAGERTQSEHKLIRWAGMLDWRVEKIFARIASMLRTGLHRGVTQKLHPESQRKI